MDKIDKIDKKILAILKKNARLTASAISDEIEFSVSAVIERIKKLEAAQIIKKYTVCLDQKKIGNEISGIIEIQMKGPEYYAGFIEFVKSKSYIDTCYYKTGKCDFMLHISTVSTDGLEKINREIKSCEGVYSTQTHVILDVIKEDCCVLPEE